MIGSALLIPLSAGVLAVSAQLQAGNPASLDGGGSLPQPCLEDFGPLERSGAMAGDRFGSGLAVEGGLAVVGAEQVDDNGPGSGAAYVFEFDGSQWIESAQLLASDGADNNRFGVAAAISGQRLAIGAPAAAAPDTFFAGAVYVFEDDGSQWTETIKITAKEPLGGDQFGGAIDLDGDVLVVGVPGDDELGINSGTAQIFVRESSGWTLRGKLQDAAGTSDDLFGGAVAVDGATAVAGASGSADNAGAVFVFTQNSLDWPLQAKLTASDGRQGDRFGTAVAVHGDTMAVGATSAPGGGAVYVYARAGSNWVEQARIAAPAGGEADDFGGALALVEDRLIVGAVGVDGDGDEAGAIYAFERSGSAWGPAYRLDPPGAGALEQWGFRVAASEDTVVVSSQRDDGLGGARGYEMGTAVELYCTAKTNSLGCSPTIGYFGCPSASVDSGFVVSCSSTLNQKLGMLLYSVQGRDAVPFQGATLCLASPFQRTPARTSGGPPKPIKTCTGAYRIDMAAYGAGALGGDPHPALLLPGTLVTCQWWARDPGLPAPDKIILSDALEYEIAP